MEQKSQLRVVPMGYNYADLKRGLGYVSHVEKGLEVLRSCISFAFENKVSDALKVLNAVKAMLKESEARVCLVNILSSIVTGTTIELRAQQFRIIVELLESALSNDSVTDEFGIAHSILPISNNICKVSR